jgi:hypothetical protein
MREACRNLELIWLLKNLKPGYRTIANFRKENWKALKAVNRSFVLLVRELGLVGGSVVAIDGSFFHGDASKAGIFTRKRLAEQIAKLDLEIEAYGKSLEDNDAAEAKADRTDGPGNGRGGDGSDVGAKVVALMAKRSRAQADLARLEDSGEMQLSLTDPDARLLVKGGQGVADYNVQAVVDDKHKLIVASEVVNDSSDVGQLHAMAKAAKDALQAEPLQQSPTEGVRAGRRQPHFQTAKPGPFAAGAAGCSWLSFTPQERDDGRLILGALLIEQDADREPRNEDANSHCYRPKPGTSLVKHGESNSSR